MRRRTIVAGAIAATLLAGGTAAPAIAATVTTQAGPFASITTKTDLNCGAELAGVAEELIYRPSATCATLVAADGMLNLPNDESLSWTFDNARTWTPVSQSTTGDGTIFDPLNITTVAAGESIELTQVDTYASGASSYSTEITVRNTGATVLSPIVYRVINCTSGEPWEHAAYAEAGADDNAPLCRGAEGLATGQWGERMHEGQEILQLIPHSTQSNYALGKRRDVLSGIEAQLPFGSVPGSSGQPIENLLAMSWELDLQPGASSTVSFQTHSSATGDRAVPVSLTSSESIAGQSTVTASFGTADAQVGISGGSQITLPVGASYVKGSSTIGEPMIVNDMLLFTAPPEATDTSFSFRITGGEAGATGQVKLEGSTANGIDFVQASLEIVLEPHTPEVTPTPSPTVLPTPTSSTPVQPSATTVPTLVPTATPAATTSQTPMVSTNASGPPAAVPQFGELATTGASDDFAPLGSAAVVLLLLGGGVTAIAFRRRAEIEQR